MVLADFRYDPRMHARWWRSLVVLALLIAASTSIAVARVLPNESRSVSNSTETLPHAEATATELPSGSVPHPVPTRSVVISNRDVVHKQIMRGFAVLVAVAALLAGLHALGFRSRIRSRFSPPLVSLTASPSSRRGPPIVA